MAMLPHEHERHNARHFPGTRQMCVWCDEPTSRCEEDSIYLDDGTGPLCEECSAPYYQQEEKEEQEMIFDIQRLRNLTTGRLHTDIHHVYEDLGALFGEEGIMTHMIPNAMKAVEPWLREKVTDPYFWDGEHRPSHVGQVRVPSPTLQEQKEMFERFSELPSPLFSKKKEA